MPTTFARSLAAIGLCLVVTGTMACGGTKQDAKTPTSGGGDGKDGAVEVGKHAPDLSIQTVNGQGSISLDSLQGKVAVIDFWATWCGPCKQSFPKLESLSKRHAGKVVIVGVSVDDDKDGVVPFAKANGASFPIGWDDGHAIANRWHVETMPTTIILDSTGTVRYIHAGYHDDEPEQVDKELLGLVNETPSKSGDKATAVASNDPPPSTTSGDDPPKADDAPAPPPKKAVKPKKGSKKKKPKKADPSAA